MAPLCRAVVFLILSLLPLRAQAPQEVAIHSHPYTPPSMLLQAESNLVEVALTVRDRNGQSVAGLQESLKATDLIEDALRLNAGAVERHHVQVIREFSETPPLLVDKHKVLQILVNLIRNAKYALEDRGLGDKRMILRVAPVENGSVKLSVVDNGVGIVPENLTRIFEHGFTTRQNGHGFALHSGALAARQMGGSLTCHSAGPGQGAAFTLELPLRPPEAAT